MQHVATHVACLAQVPLHHMGPVFALLDQRSVKRLGEHYNADGSLRLHVAVEASLVEMLQSDLMNATSGTVTLEVTNQ